MGPVVLIRSEHARGAYAVRVLRALARRFLVELGHADGEVSVVVTTDARIRKINREWRDKDKPTDVLSFPAGDVPRLPGRGRPLGDVVISLDTTRRRARDEGRRQRDELARYLAHGLLHLLGHDHHEPGEARRMARAEDRLLGDAGMVASAGEAQAGGSEADTARGPTRRRGAATPGSARASTATSRGATRPLGPAARGAAGSPAAPARRPRRASGGPKRPA